ncbi:hypothetical protein PsorP6_010043 [Peronosclerospora sorghi]|uniref:Uncharacterized protein n=1 Tax=Peronosclerospora sorghi TaxID=230839 RepID=A0ACC0VW08_9STRA|nr:hypothetical protein PsorP6_010043 [Peronosclerospora sorghi]
MRAAGSDENIKLSPIRQMSLEDVISYISEDEIIDVSPSKIRMRKRDLNASGRKRQILPHLEKALQEANTKINHMLPDRTAIIKLKSRLNAASKERDQAMLRAQFYSEEVRRLSSKAYQP